MNVVQRATHGAFRFRAFATAAFVPPAALENVQRVRPPATKPKPESPTFYTGRANYYDQLLALEAATKHTRSALQRLELLPLPRFASENLPPLHPVWKSKLDLAEQMDARLTTSRYRRFLAQLNQLNEYKRLAEVAGHVQLAGSVQRVLEGFERDNKEAVLARGKRKPVKFDEYGRSYTIGRRKESTARAWVIAVQPPADAATSSVEGKDASPSVPSVSASLGAASETTLLNPTPVKVPTTNILINNTPLAEYFPHLTDRERIIRPFRIAGLIGAYNAFVLVRGGGTTGQSGAVTLAIAKALAAHAPDVEGLLRKAKLLKRDPRMVERKKTGRAKANKAYTWVKR